MSPEGMKNARNKLQAIALSLSNLTESSFEIDEALTKVKAGRQWLGEALTERGFTSPYKDSYDVSNEKIAPPDYMTDPDYFTPKDGSRIKHVKELRAQLQTLAEGIRQEMITGSTKQFYRLSTQSAYVSIVQARMWLGEELNRIKTVQQGDT